MDFSTVIIPQFARYYAKNVCQLKGTKFSKPGNNDFNNLLMKNNFRLQAFINEAESLLNSSTLALEKFDLNKSTGYTPSVIGAQEVYR